MKVILATDKYINQAAKILSQEWYDSELEAKEELRMAIQERVCLIAIQNEDVLGVLIYNRACTHYANWCEDLAVSTQHRRKGVATSLLKEYIKISKKEQPKEQKIVLSSTDQSNSTSIRLHEKVGFKKIGEIKGLHFNKDEIILGYRL